MVWLALPALLTRSAVGMESRFFATMKWLPTGFPGSVSHGLACFACLADSIRSRHGITILCHDEMAVLWLPRISLAWLALPALLTRSAVGMESRFSTTMKWLPYGFPGSVSHVLARFACLADSIHSRRGITILRHNEMAAHWFPRISLTSSGLLCLPC